MSPQTLRRFLKPLWIKRYEVHVIGLPRFVNATTQALAILETTSHSDNLRVARVSLIDARFVHLTAAWRDRIIAIHNGDWNLDSIQYAAVLSRLLVRHVLYSGDGHKINAPENEAIAATTELEVLIELGCNQSQLEAAKWRAYRSAKSNIDLYSSTQHAAHVGRTRNRYLRRHGWLSALARMKQRKKIGDVVISGTSRFCRATTDAIEMLLTTSASECVTTNISSIREIAGSAQHAYIHVRPRGGIVFVHWKEVRKLHPIEYASLLAHEAWHNELFRRRGNKLPTFDSNEYAVGVSFPEELECDERAASVLVELRAPEQAIKSAREGIASMNWWTALGKTTPAKNLEVRQ